MIYHFTLNILKSNFLSVFLIHDETPTNCISTLQENNVPEKVIQGIEKDIQDQHPDPVIGVGFWQSVQNNQISDHYINLLYNPEGDLETTCKMIFQSLSNLDNTIEGGFSSILAVTMLNQLFSPIMEILKSNQLVSDPVDVELIWTKSHLN